MTQIIGIDIGGTNVKLAFVSEAGKITEKWQIPTRCAENGSQITGDIIQAIQEKLQEKNQTIKEFSGIGIGVPGPVVKDIVKRAVNLGWHNEPLGENISEAFHLPTTLLNDANAAALGELWKGSNQEVCDAVFVTLGTGVGGGIILNGKILEGNTASGGEIGHIPVFSEERRICGCGNTNCLETYASANGLFQTMTQMVKESKDDIKFENTKDIFQLKNLGEPLAEQAVMRTVEYLAHALAGIMNTLDVQEIIIGGGLAEAGDNLLTPLKNELDKALFPQIRGNYHFRKAVVGNDAGVLGAAYQSLQNQNEKSAASVSM